MSSPAPLPKVAPILQVKVQVSPKDRELFLSHCKPLCERVSAEPECAYFNFGEDVQNPGVFRWTEGWTKDVAWLMSVQIKKFYYEPYLAATEKMFTADRIIEAYAPGEGTGHVNAALMKDLEMK